MTFQATRSSGASRVARTVAGGVLLAAGLALLVLPGPGLLFIALAVSILAVDYVWTRRLLHRIKRSQPTSPGPHPDREKPQPPPRIGQYTNGAADMHPPALAVSPATVAVYRVNDRVPGTGRILGPSAGSPTDTAVAWHSSPVVPQPARSPPACPLPGSQPAPPDRN